MLIPGALYYYRIMFGKVQQAAENITPWLIRVFPWAGPEGPTQWLTCSSSPA